MRCARRLRWAPTAPSSISDSALEGADLLGTAKALAGALEQEGADLVLFGQQSADGGGACLWAAVAERLRRPVDLAGQRADGRRRLGDRQAADRVRLRHDPRAAAGGRRGAGCDQHAALPVAEGDHGREEEAAGDARRPADVGGAEASATTVLALSPPPARGEARKIEDDGSARGEDRRVPRREEARLMAKTLVFLEHHEGAIAEGLARRAREGGAARRRRRRRARRCRRARTRAECGCVGAAPSGSPTTQRSRRRCRSRVSTCSRSSSRRGLRHGALRAVGARRRRRGRARRAARRGSQLGSRRLRRRDGQGAAAAGHGRSSTSAGRAPCKLGDLPRRRARRGRDAAARPRCKDAAVELEDFSTLAEMVEQAHAEQQGPSIEDADVIVAGGRGLGEPEKFALAEELAQALGGAVAATRAVVDAGWYPYSAQVGQTGKTVSPKLYVALGISGRDPAQGRHAGLERDRRDQQGSERADLRVLRSRRRRRPARDRAEADRARARALTLVSVRPSDFPPPWSPAEAIAAADRSGRRAHRGRLPDRRRRPGRARRCDPARAADRGASRRRRSGSATCRSRCSRRARRPARTSCRARSSTRAGCSGCSRTASGSTSCRSTGAVDGESVLFLTKRRALRMPTPPTMVNHRNYVASLSQLGAVPRRGGGGARRDDPARDVGREAARRRRARASACAPATAGAGGTGEELVELRARLGHHRARDDPLRGHAGSPDRRGARPVRAAQREPAGVGARRQGGLEGREAAATQVDPHDGLAAARRGRSSASSAARSSTRWATTWSRSAWSSGSTTATRSCRCTTCCRS